MKYIIKRLVMIFVLCMTITNVLAYDFAVENEDGVIIYYKLITLSTSVRLNFTKAKVGDHLPDFD